MIGLTPSNLQLRIVPVHALQLHEEDDPRRVKQLMKYLVRDGKLKNPIIVAELTDRPGKFVVLDGATRTSALEKLEVSTALVQVVDYLSPNIELKVWHHVISGFPPHRILSGLSSMHDLKVRPTDSNFNVPDLGSMRILACLTLREESKFVVLIEGDVYELAMRLCDMVSIYRGKAVVHRSAEVNLVNLIEEYPDMTTVVSFPQFTPAEIMQIASNGNKVPMGITRHLITGRALGLCAPLELLRSEESLEAKNQWLAQQIRHRLHGNKIRLYQEPVFIFDD